MTKDYYNFWNKNRTANRLLHREKLALGLVEKYSKKNNSILDVGCGNGKFIEAMSRVAPGSKISGLDFSDAEIKEAQKNGLDVSKANFENGIPVPKNKLDLVYAGEILEHLQDPDFFLEEINRILKNSGHLILTTPNLCAWFNRILLPLGIQPLFLEPSTRSKFVGAGVLKRFKKDSQPVGHVRIFTIAALRDLLRMNGFKLMCIEGAIYDEGLPKNIWWIDRLFSFFPSLSSNLIVVAKKIN